MIHEFKKRAAEIIWLSCAHPSGDMMGLQRGFCSPGVCTYMLWHVIELVERESDEDTQLYCNQRLYCTQMLLWK